MKIVALLFISAMLAASINAQHNPNDECTKNCTRCFVHGICMECVFSILDPKLHYNCVPPTSEEDPNCVSFIINESGKNICTMCRPGFTLEYTGFGPQTVGTCLKEKVIDNCVIGFKSSEGKATCKACQGGFPDNQQTVCTPFNGEPEAQNCIIGIPGVSYKKNSCYRCKDGFIVQGGKCQKRPDNKLRGCLTMDSTEYCEECDVMGGYYMQFPGVCAWDQSMGEKPEVTKIE